MYLIILVVCLPQAVGLLYRSAIRDYAVCQAGQAVTANPLWTAQREVFVWL